MENVSHTELQDIIFSNISYSFNRWLCDTNCTFEESDEDIKNGTFPTEVLVMSSILPGLSLFLSILPPIVLSLYSRKLSHAVLMNVFSLLILTILSDYTFAIVIGMVLVGLISVYLMSKLQHSVYQNIKRSSVEKSIWSRENLLNIKVGIEGNQLPYIADYRANILLATAVSILAVDFPLLPLRHSKTETYGWSVMDCGVGSFVFVHGICSSEARKIHRGGGFRKSVMSSLPLLLLGLGRFLAVNAVDYHQSVSEYGIHWNFFFTLAATKIVSSVLNSLLHSMWRSSTTAITLMALHQWILSCCGITTLVMNEDRTSFVKANKEGIFSLLGFVVIYLAGVEVGKIIWETRSRMKEYLKLLMFLIVVGVVGWTIMFTLHMLVQPISRRMANSTYCVWMVSLSCWQIAFHLMEHLLLVILHHQYGTDLWCRHRTNSVKINMESNLLSKAINYNGLFYFLMSNVLTGFVNITLEPDQFTTGASLVVMIGYLATLLSFILIMFYNTVQIKFW